MTNTKIKISSWKDLRNEIKNIPIEEVALLREGELGVEKRGYQLFGLCPFHSDQRVGNFALGGPHNGFKCFSCDAAGDSIDLIMKVDSIGFKEALITIARETKIMNEGEIEAFINEGKSTNITRTDWGIDLSSDAYAELTDEDRVKRNIVYGLLSEGRAIVNPVSTELGVEKEQRLNNKHYYHLKNDRGLSDKEIEDAGFFSMDDNFNYIGPLYYRLINELNQMPNILNVPGFWRNSNNVAIPNINKSDGTVIELDEDNKQFFWNFDPMNALGIPIKDEFGNIVAIQLRPDDRRDNSPKYIWFSSSNTRYQKEKTDGSSPGAQMDVMYPKKWNTPHLFITEGKFKSISINKHLRSASISLQGINTYRGVGEVIENINLKHSKDIKNIFVLFDGDMSFNDSVINAVLNMSDNELDGYTVYVGVWDYLFGKGIDDLINNGHSDALARITIDDLRVIADIISDVGSDGNITDVNELKQIKEDLFYQWLADNNSEIKLHPIRRLK